jgi:hypothetical protein
MVSFAPVDAVQEAAGRDVPVTLEYRLPTLDFLAGAPHDGPEVRAFDARNFITDILRQAWEMFATAQGLKSHEMAHGACWYVPSGLFEKDKAKFRDPDGRARWRAMIGVRGKHRIRWHYALSVRATLTDPFRLVVRSHVVFSEDTKTLVTDAKRALRLRKWLCKTWWNDDFRDRLLGLMSQLSRGQPTMELPLGGDTVAVVASTPLTFLSPLSYVRHGAAGEPDSAKDGEPEDEVLAPGDISANGNGDVDDNDDFDDDELDDGENEQ